MQLMEEKYQEQANEIFSNEAEDDPFSASTSRNIIIKRKRSWSYDSVLNTTNGAFIFHKKHGSSDHVKLVITYS